MVFLGICYSVFLYIFNFQKMLFVFITYNFMKYYIFWIILFNLMEINIELKSHDLLLKI